jgi:hypothetical protein
LQRSPLGFIAAHLANSCRPPYPEAASEDGARTA